MIRITQFLHGSGTVSEVLKSQKKCPSRDSQPAGRVHRNQETGNILEHHKAVQPCLYALLYQRRFRWGGRAFSGRGKEIHDRSCRDENSPAHVYGRRTSAPE